MSTPAPALNADQRALLGEFESAISADRKLREEAQVKMSAEMAEKLRASDARCTDLGTKVVEMGEELAKAREEVRQLQQKSLLLPPGAGEIAPARSFGHRMQETPEFKGFPSLTGKFQLHFSVPGRIFERKANTITEAGSGYPIIAQRVGMYTVPNELPLVMRDICPVVNLANTNAIEYVKETWNYAADYQVAEGDKKAQGDVTYTDATALVRTIAWYVKVSKQMLQDVPIIAQTIDSRLTYGVMKKEEHEILWGDNAAGHLHGIMPQATALTAALLPDADTSIDLIASAIAQLASTGFAATAVVMNGLVWGNMQVMKNTMGGYLLQGPPYADAQARIWGIPIVTTPEMTGLNFLVGSFPGNCAIFDRLSVTVDVAYENEDDFTRNLVTFRAEERIAFAVFLPQAFVKGTFPASVAAGREAPAAGREGGNNREAGREPAREQKK